MRQGREEGTEAHALASLLYLVRRARQARDTAELRFALVNETHGLVPYRQAALWLKGSGVAALSGVVSVEGNAPYVQWLSGVFRHLENTASEPEPRVLCAADLPEAAVAEWGEWLPSEAILLPLPALGKRFPGGALLLARDEAWAPSETAFLAEWAAAWAHAYAFHHASALRHFWRFMTGKGRSQRAPDTAGTARRGFLGWRRIRPMTWALMALAGLAFLPVQLTVLAPAEVVPLNPSIARSPLDGIIEHVAVTPNQRVRAQDILFEFDRTTISNQLRVAETSLETVRTEYRQRAQQALFDPASKAHLAVLQGQVSEKTLEIEYLRELERRSTVVSPHDGIVLFDDPAEWIGRPVVTGERVMVVAVEDQVEVEAWLAPANAIELEDGAPVTLYLNADPLQPLSARLRYVAHEATRRPDGTYAYRVRASLTEGRERARTGLTGTAKLEGDRVPLIYWVLRRPLASTRAWLGI